MNNPAGAPPGPALWSRRARCSLGGDRLAALGKLRCQVSVLKMSGPGAGVGRVPRAGVFSGCV